jgi:hypothetical protein
MGAGDNEISSISNAEIQLLQNLMISRYFAAAGLVLLLYDTALTMDDEVSKFPTQTSCAYSLQVRLVWPGPLKVPKLLYLINRYWTSVFLIAANYGKSQVLK